MSSRMAVDDSDSDEEAVLQSIATRRPASQRVEGKQENDAEEGKERAGAGAGGFFSRGASQQQPSVPRESLDAIRSFLLTPVGRESPPLQFYVIRNRSGRHMLSPLYSMFAEQGDQFLMAGKKRMANRTSNYLIAMDKAPGDRSSDRVVGKLRSDTVGSEYMLYDSGMNPEQAESEMSRRRELGVVFFQYDKMGPGRMRVFVPGMTRGNVPVSWRPAGREDGLAAAALREGGPADGVMSLMNKRPRWDAKAGGHVLNFHGRVTKSSVKNFQLISDITGDDTVLQFGKVDSNRFTLDVAHPLSPFQGFAIALATLDRKFADSRAYERWRGRKGDDAAQGK